MVSEMIDGTFRQTNLTNESSQYLAKREELRLAEVALMQQRERVAELRRSLPQGAPLKDYVFLEGPADLDAGDTPVETVRLSELFTAPRRALVIHQMMFGKKNTSPCPMCTMWLDGWNAVVPHLAESVDIAVVAAAAPAAGSRRPAAQTSCVRGGRDPRSGIRRLESRSVQLVGLRAAGDRYSLNRCARRTRRCAVVSRSRAATAS